MKIVKKSIIYLKKHGVKQTLRHIRVRLEWMYSKVKPYKEPIHDEKGPLNRYEFKYYRFLKNRKLRFDVSFDDFAAGCEKGLVSLILPAGEDANALKAAVDSVLCQTHKQFELLIVCSASSESVQGTANMCAQQDERIRVIAQEKASFAQTVNAGLAQAKGELLTWITPDMRLHDRFIETLSGALERDAKLAMCYADVRAVDEKGNPDASASKYIKDRASGHVRLPDAALRLNTYCENTVSKAWMLRRAALKLIGGLDEGIGGAEEYDCWMRINDFFGLRHAAGDDVLCDCRLSGEADKQLDKQQHRLLLTEDYRQDWLLRQTCWVFASEEEAEQWRALVEDRKNIVRRYDEAIRLCWPQLGSGVIQATIAGKDGCAAPQERITEDAVRVLIVPEGMTAQNAQAFDFVVEIAADLAHVSAGAICARDAKTAVDLVQMYAKATGFDKMLKKNRTQEAPALKASIVLCTYKRVDAAEAALKAMTQQDFDPKAYEILVVNNDPLNRDMQRIAETADAESACAVRYIDCPYPGLSSARNFSMYPARGEILLYVDDDGIMEKDCLTKLVRAFDAHQDAGVIGGQILLKDPERFSDVILPGFNTLWSERRVSGQRFFYVHEDVDFPYGCNFAIRRGILRDMGGFRLSYGRMGKDFAAGEETVLSYLVLRAGMRVGIEPEAVIWHDVDPARFTLEHVKQTLRASRMTNRLMKLDMYKESDPKMKEEKYSMHSAKDRLAYMKKTGVAEDALEYLYCQYDIAALEAAVEAGRVDREIMETARAEFYGRS